MLIRLNNERAVTIKAKKAIIRVHAFPMPPVFYKVKYQSIQRFAYSSIAKTIVGKALFCHLVKKTPDLNMHNFQILRIL